MDLEQLDPADPSSVSFGSLVPARHPPAMPDYELLRCIGRGSYDDVWLARNVLGQIRAVKFVDRDRFSDPRPFEREFEGLQRFEPISRSHPSQLHILHVGKNEAAGCFYYVMELADDAMSSVGADVRRPPDVGSYSPRTLRSELEHHGRLPIPDCIQIGLSLTTALAHLHEQGLVHRDIKPSNVVFVNGLAKLGDIGLVTDAGDTHSIVGTEGYLPPEGPGTPQADIYSLGKVLYEISTGMDRRRCAELPEDLRSWPDRSAVVEFNEIVLKACEASPARRYPFAGSLGAELSALHAGKSVVKQRRHQRWRAQSVKVASVVLLLAGLLLLIRGIAQGRLNPSDRLSESALALNEFKQGVHCRFGTCRRAAHRRPFTSSARSRSIRTSPWLTTGFTKFTSVTNP